MDIIKKHDLQIEIVDEANFGIRVSLYTHIIYLPIAAMEYVWSQSFRFWVVSQEYYQAQRDGNQNFDLNGTRRLNNAAKIVEWSVENIQQTGKKPWPLFLPRPRKYPCNEDVKVANELFFGAMGWIILHEVAHVELGHAELSGSYSQQQEREADQFATEWILGGLQETDPRFKKRVFCVAVALLCLQSLETVAAPRWCGTHPPAHERISYCLDKYRGQDTEKVKAFLAVCLQVLFAGTAISEITQGSCFDEILNEYFFNISRRNS